MMRTTLKGIALLTLCAGCFVGGEDEGSVSLGVASEPILNGTATIGTINAARTVLITHPDLVYPTQVDVCTGTLLSNRYVLTGQHCTENPVGTTHTVSNNQFSFQQVSATRVMRNQLAMPDANQNRVDASIIYLNTPMSLLGNAAAFSTPITSTAPVVGDTFECLGYGNTTWDGVTQSGAGNVADLRRSSLTVDNANLTLYAFDLAVNGSNQSLAGGDSGGPCFRSDGSLTSVTTTATLAGPAPGQAIKPSAFRAWANATVAGWRIPYGLGGGAIAASGANIAATSRTSSITDTFVVRSDGKVWNAAHWVNGQNGNAWYPPYVLDNQTSGTFVPNGGIAATHINANRTNLFAIRSGKVWSAGWWDTAGPWNAPGLLPNQNQTFVSGGGIAAVVRASPGIDVFTVGADGRTWVGAWTDGTNWYAPYVLDNQTLNSWVAGGGIAAVSRNTSITDTFVVGQDGAVWNAGWWQSGVNGNHWNAPYRVSPTGMFTPGAPIAAVSRDGVSTDLYVVDASGVTWNAGWWRQGVSSNQGNAFGWNAPYRLDVLLPSQWAGSAGLAVVARTSGIVDTFVVGKDGSAYNGGWWEQLP